ncbi:MAG: DUF971 domain-containing protein [Endozoicomonas sp. (ex Botrylloides leachii)]|nr:DUF971 domain-containing protein [Endozoicomonas sp. (ex Botrylloides leachii)]
MKRNIPIALNIHKVSKSLSLRYSEEETYSLPAEYLRVLSPSAEVRGHGKPVLQAGKMNVNIIRIEPMGQYAIRLLFDDGHDSGIYTWNYLYDLCINQATHWDTYLKSLYHAGASRDPDATIIKIMR